MKKLLIIMTICAAIGLLAPYCQEVMREKLPMVVLDSYDQIRAIFSDVSPDTLMIFDVDDTLIEGDINDPFAHGVDNLPFLVRVLFFLQHPSLFVSSRGELFYSLVWQHAPRHLIEPCTKWVSIFH
jgi:hypothetical protein